MWKYIAGLFSGIIITVLGGYILYSIQRHDQSKKEAPNLKFSLLREKEPIKFSHTRGGGKGFRPFKFLELSVHNKSSVANRLKGVALAELCNEFESSACRCQFHDSPPDLEPHLSRDIIVEIRIPLRSEFLNNPSLGEVKPMKLLFIDHNEKEWPFVFDYTLGDECD